MSPLWWTYFSLLHFDLLYAMASGSSSGEGAASANPRSEKELSCDVKLTECPICLLEFSSDVKQKNAPKLFHCGHTVCGSCLSQLPLSQVNETRTALICPICRQPSLVNDASEMKVNFTLVELLAALAVTTSPLQAFLCSDCNTAEAALFCQNCESPFCTPCFGEAHPSTSKALQRHKAQNIADWKKAQLATCLDHHEPMKLYCLQDSTLLCTICQVSGSHRNHDVRFVGDVAGDARVALQRADGLLSEKIVGLRNATQRVQQTVTAVEASSEAAISKLRTRFNELVRTVRTREQELFLSIVKLKDQKTTALVKQQDDLANNIARLEVVVDEIRRAGRESDVGVLQAGAEAKGMTALKNAEGCPCDPVMGAAIPISLSGDGAIEKSITGYGNVGELLETPRLSVNYVTNTSVELSWTPLPGAAIYELQMCCACKVDASTQPTAGARYLSRKDKRGGTKCVEQRTEAAPLLMAPVEYAVAPSVEVDNSAFSSVYSGSNLEVKLIRTLKPGFIYMARVRGIAAFAVVGSWSAILSFETDGSPENIFDGLADNIDWPAGSTPLCIGGRADGARAMLSEYQVCSSEYTLKGSAGKGKIGYVEARVRSAISKSTDRPFYGFSQPQASATPQVRMGFICKPIPPDFYSQYSQNAQWLPHGQSLGYEHLCDSEHQSILAQSQQYPQFPQRQTQQINTNVHETISWSPAHHSLTICLPPHYSPTQYKAPAINDGQLMGLMIDCRGPNYPVIRFFIDKQEVGSPQYLNLDTSKKLSLYSFFAASPNYELQLTDSPRLLDLKFENASDHWQLRAPLGTPPREKQKPIRMS